MAVVVSYPLATEENDLCRYVGCTSAGLVAALVTEFRESYGGLEFPIYLILDILCDLISLG